MLQRQMQMRHQPIVIRDHVEQVAIDRLHRRDGRVALLAENAAYAPLELGGEQELCIWGVVTACVKRFT